MKIDRYHWYHYFGGVAFILFFVQLVTGIFLGLFYKPHLLEAYASVQVLYKDFELGAWFREAHRWTAFFIVSGIVMHVTRSLLRKEFLNYEKRIVWLTGSLLLFIIMALLITGFILPWEWRGYWFMEMLPNHMGSLPFIGPEVQQYLIDTFSISRNFMAHVVILPVITVILVDFHIFAKLRKKKGGIPRYLLKHALVTIPFFVIIGLLTVYVQMPTQDPESIPMPLDGTNIPEPEWFYLLFLMPYMHFEETMAAFLALYLPLGLFLLLTSLPYLFKNYQLKVTQQGPENDPGEARLGFKNLLKGIFLRKSIPFAIVFVVAGVMFGMFYKTVHVSPTMGCNSCHNISMGTGIGIPPEAYKDRIKEPKNGDKKWMVEHWFYPQVTW